MKRLVAIASSMFLVSQWSSVAGAQSFPHLAISVEGKLVRPIGGEAGSLGSSTGPIVLGETTTNGFSQIAGMCGFGGVGPGPNANARTAWVVSVTPTRVEGDAVTFRLQWSRVREEGRPVTAPQGDISLTLRPGESLPVDIVPVPPREPSVTGTCDIRAVSIRVGVTAWPRPGEDRRLLATDLWLVQRLPDGSERSQALAIKGLFNQSTPFYFDAIADGDSSLDFFGEFTINPTNNGIGLALQTRSRLVQGARMSTSMPAPPEVTAGFQAARGRGPAAGRGGAPDRIGLQVAREVKSTLLLKGDEVVAVDLPRLSENASGAFFNHAFSIRIRSHQVR